ncbi:hypothetical protein ACTG16_23355 [Aeromonas sp. 23P]|uniref:hypothetical protein n=1 Tax=Aeromonas sp. 23P TaxID=3452716 RepID=UPI003F794650|nr:hypothetical protein [Aeromonas veronii]
MNANIKVTAKNNTATALLARLVELNRSALGCFHEGNFCIKVPVKNLSDAMKLGMSLGDHFGHVTHYDSPKAIVFIDAHCQAR